MVCSRGDLVYYKEQLALVIRNPYEDTIQLSTMNGHPILDCILCVDLMIGEQIYKKIPISEIQKIK